MAAAAPTSSSSHHLTALQQAFIKQFADHTDLGHTVVDNYLSDPNKISAGISAVFKQQITDQFIEALYKEIAAKRMAPILAAAEAVQHRKDAIKAVKSKRSQSLPFTHAILTPPKK